MTYTPTQTLTVDQFIAQHGNNTRYELADGELIDMEPTGPHEIVGGKLATHIGMAIAQANYVVSSNWETDYARKVEEYALLGIPKYWIVDYRGLGGVTSIGKPKQPTFTVCQLTGDEYNQSKYRLGEAIASAILPNVQLRLDDILPLY